MGLIPTRFDEGDLLWPIYPTRKGAARCGECGRETVGRYVWVPQTYAFTARYIIAKVTPEGAAIGYASGDHGFGDWAEDNCFTSEAAARAECDRRNEETKTGRGK